MSFFNCPHCDGRIDVFGHGEGKRIAEMYSVPLLGEIESIRKIRIGGDTREACSAFGPGRAGAKVSMQWLAPWPRAWMRSRNPRVAQ